MAEDDVKQDDTTDNVDTDSNKDDVNKDDVDVDTTDADDSTDKADNDADTSADDDLGYDGLDTGTDTGNDVLTYLQETGVAADTAKALLYDAVKAGDPSKIDLDALKKATGSDASARIIVSGIKSYIAEINSKTAEIHSVVNEVVGSADNWKQLTTWARENLPENELQDYIEMVGQGGRKAKLAAKDLLSQYEDAGNTSFEVSTTVPKKGGKSTTTIQPLSRIEYYEAMEKAKREGKLTESTNQKLWKQRQAGIRAGK